MSFVAVTFNVGIHSEKLKGVCKNEINVFSDNLTNDKLQILQNFSA